MKDVVSIVTSEFNSMLQPIIDKIGVSAIASTVGLTTAQEADIIPKTTMLTSEWVMTDYALAISMVSGVLFGIEKIVNITIKIRDRRNNKEK